MRGARQQKARAAGYRTERSLTGLIRLRPSRPQPPPHLRWWMKQPISALEQMLGWKGGPDCRHTGMFMLYAGCNTFAIARISSSASVMLKSTSWCGLIAVTSSGERPSA